MSRTHKLIGTAKTLGELPALIEKAIAVAGADAQWNGFDDGSIYIHSKDDDPGSEEEPIPGWYEIKNR